MALLDPALAQTWTRHRLGFRPSPQDTDLAFGQVPKTQTFEDLAFSQVLEDTNLAPGQVLRTRNRLSPCPSPCVPLGLGGNCGILVAIFYIFSMLSTK